MRKKVLITGGARGLGRSIAQRFAKENYDIILTYLTSEKEAKLVKLDLESSFGVEVLLVPLDLKDEESIKSLFLKFDSLDVLINNAALNDDKDPFDKTQADFVDILKINLIGPFLMSKYAFPLLKKTRGNIVNVASTNGIDTMYKESLDYDASKAGLINLTKNLSSMFGADVRVNAVAPGWIETDKTSDMEPKYKECEQQKIVCGRFGNADEIANAVFFLASNEASYIDGTILRIDGGMKYGNR